MSMLFGSTMIVSTVSRRLASTTPRLQYLCRFSLLQCSQPYRVTSSLSRVACLSSSTTETTSNTTKKRPFAILGVQQIAIGAEKRESLHRLWYDVFGLQPSERNIEMPGENVCEDIVRLGGTGPETAIEIDLMTPMDPEKSPKVHVPPLNHLGLWVDDLPKAVEWMTQQGVRFTPGGIRQGAAGYDVIFIHPKGNEAAPISGNGVLIELVQAPPNVVRTLSCMPTKEPVFY